MNNNIDQLQLVWPFLRQEQQELVLFRRCLLNDSSPKRPSVLHSLNYSSQKSTQIVLQVSEQSLFGLRLFVPECEACSLKSEAMPDQFSLSEISDSAMSIIQFIVKEVSTCLMSSTDSSHSGQSNDIYYTLFWADILPLSKIAFCSSRVLWV